MTWFYHIKPEKSTASVKQISQQMERWEWEGVRGAVVWGPTAVAKAETPTQPEPSPAKPQSHTRWHGCKEETQIPESFLRQSVPIKVLVTVGKLKQKWELQRSTEKAGNVRRERLRRDWRDLEKEIHFGRSAPSPSWACNTPTGSRETQASVYADTSAYFTPSHQEAWATRPRPFLLFHRCKAKLRGCPTLKQSLCLLPPSRPFLHYYHCFSEREKPASLHHC